MSEITKKVIFFDGDGTLWYPKTTERTRPPQWVYLDEAITDPITELVITPTTKETLSVLGGLGIMRVLLSTCPLPEEEAVKDRVRAARHVDIHHLLDDVQVAPDHPGGKGERIVTLLGKYGIGKEHALMVGDTFERDYQSALAVGVEGLLIRTDYHQEFVDQLDGSQIIADVGDVLGHI